MTIDPQLAALELRDANDKPWKVGDLWAERPALLVFIRHFG